MGLNTFVALAVTVIALLAYWFKKKFSYWENRGFKFVEPEFPFGSLKGVGYKIHFGLKSRQYYLDFKDKAKAIGLYFFTAPVVLVTDLDTIKHVLVKDFNNFHDRGLYVNTKADPLSGHLFAIEGMEWKNMRAKLTPTFTSGKMKLMFGTVFSICQEMINFLNENEKSVEIEMKDILARFTTDVIGNVAFGLDMNSMRNPDSMFRKMGRRVFDTPPLQTLKVLTLTTFRKFTQNFNIMINNQEVSDFFLSSIRETVEYRESNDIKRNDFLSLLLQIKNHGKISDDVGEAIGKLTMEELAAQSFLFFLAG
jgi:cytochrome P450 family 6